MALFGRKKTGGSTGSSAGTGNGARAASSFGFIKKNTRGTSNEISFSVLDAKKNVSVSTEGGPVHSPKRQVWEFTQDEVDQKKRVRVRSRRFATLTLVLAGVAVAVGVGFIAITNFHNQQDHVAQLKTYIGQIVQTSNNMQPFESAMTAALTQNLGEIDEQQHMNAVDSALTDVFPNSKTEFEELRAQVQQIEPNLRSAVHLEAAHQFITVCNASLNLVEIGQYAAPKVAAALHAHTLAKNAMDTFMEADSRAREAAALMSSPSQESANLSIQKSQETAMEFDNAKMELVEAKTRLENAGIDAEALQPFIDYAQLRIDAQSMAIESDQAYIDRDKEKLQSANDSYNATEQQAAEIIVSQQVYPPEIVQAAFDGTKLEVADSWQSELARAQVALKALKDYAK